jgi:hypothetical protein
MNAAIVETSWRAIAAMLRPSCAEARISVLAWPILRQPANDRLEPANSASPMMGPWPAGVRRTGDNLD